MPKTVAMERVRSVREGFFELVVHAGLDDAMN